MGAWIETIRTNLLTLSTVSHPLWVRGLKQQIKREPKVVVSRILYGCVD